MSNKQSSVRWILEELEKFELGTSEFYSKTAIINHADRMHKEEIEASYSDGYKEGYNRAIELTKWTISNLIPPHNDQQ